MAVQRDQLKNPLSGVTQKKDSSLEASFVAGLSEQEALLDVAIDKKKTDITFWQHIRDEQWQIALNQQQIAINHAELHRDQEVIKYRLEKIRTNQQESEKAQRIHRAKSIQPHKKIEAAHKRHVQLMQKTDESIRRTQAVLESWQVSRERRRQQLKESEAILAKCDEQDARVFGKPILPKQMPPVLKAPQKISPSPSPSQIPSPSLKGHSLPAPIHYGFFQRLWQLIQGLWTLFSSKKPTSNLTAVGAPHLLAAPKENMEIGIEKNCMDREHLTTTIGISVQVH